MTASSNSAYGAELQPFAGRGTSYRSGARFGPRTIRAASLLLGLPQPIRTAPGTGTPEVAGFRRRALLQIVRGLRGLDLGFDQVEMGPPYDHGDVTAILAVNLVLEFLALIASHGRTGGK